MKIVTAVVNNPGFIEIQYYTLKKYFKGDYEFIVFNDAKDFPDFSNYGNTGIKKQIEAMCSRLNIQCINIPNQNHKIISCAATRCADSMNYILHYQLQNPDKYLLLDSDMFYEINRLRVETFIGPSDFIRVWHRLSRHLVNEPFFHHSANIASGATIPVK